MAQDRAARAEALRVVKGRPAETPVLDLATTVQLYRELQAQSRQLDVLMETVRERILDAMRQTGLDEFYAGDVHAVRQVRHFAPTLDEEEAKRLLTRAGRLDEAQRTVLDDEAAREILGDLVTKGRLRKEDLPFAEPREVEALIVRMRDEGG